MSSRADLLKSIANTIADYRMGELAEPTPEHVERWIRQFDVQVQEPMLAEIDYALRRTYMARSVVESFLTQMVSSKILCGTDPREFWAGVGFLDIQTAGHSQRDLLKMFDAVLQEHCRMKIVECGRPPIAFLYLDDALFTGNRVRNDLSSWIRTTAPKEASVHIVCLALHSGGHQYANGGIEAAARAVGKRITITWWRRSMIEDRLAEINVSDVLRPVSIPNDDVTIEYVKGMVHKPVLRKPGDIGGNGFFRSEAGRHLLEQELLKAGARIRAMCPFLNAYQRPLGNMVLETLGFGSLLVTFRNCPNNAPLALWAGEPWYPLLRRKTN